MNNFQWPFKGKVNSSIILYTIFVICDVRLNHQNVINMSQELTLQKQHVLVQAVNYFIRIGDIQEALTQTLWLFGGSLVSFGLHLYNCMVLRSNSSYCIVEMCSAKGVVCGCIRSWLVDMVYHVISNFVWLCCFQTLGIFYKAPILLFSKYLFNWCWDNFMYKQVVYYIYGCIYE